MRTFKTIAIVLGAYLVGFIIEFSLAYSSEDYEGGALLLFFLILIAISAPRVGYRWFDCFFATIPFYNIFFIFRIAYRLAYLPNRDWTERTPKSSS